MRQLRELRSLVRTGDMGALRDLLVSEAEVLEGPLHVGSAQLIALAALPDRDVRLAAGNLLQNARRRGAVSHRETRREHAAAAVSRLVQTAAWDEAGRAHLDPTLLLGSVLADPICRSIEFHVPGGSVTVARGRLLAVRTLVPSLPGLTAAVDRRRLRLRWRDGRGGLDLRSPEPKHRNGDQVLRVILIPSRPIVNAEAPADPQQRIAQPSTTWPGEALAGAELHP